MGTPAGIVDIESKHSVAETIDRLLDLCKSKGLLVFARIDFAGDAARAGLKMRPMEALLFGNPKAGTALLVAAPRAGLDLPLRALAWEDEGGTVWVSMNAPRYVVERHGLAEALIANLAPGQALAENAAR